MFALLKASLIIRVASAISLQVASSGGNASSPLTYGLMFEDINHSGDGGIYAELIQNRAFQGSAVHPSTLNPWTPIGDASLRLDDTTTPLSSALPTSVQVTSTGSGTIGLSNPGWWGIDIQAQTYTGSFWVFGAYSGEFTVKLQSNSTSSVFAETTITSASESSSWVQHNFTLTPSTAAPNSNNDFIIEYDAGSANLNFNLISLFPPTYRNRENGNRIELMEALKDLNPSFLRMPGGNNIEGESTSHQQWKWNQTIGPLTNRPGRLGDWSYQNTDGIGLIEYFQWCDDLEVEPILAVWGGLYLNNYQTPADVIPEAELGAYVQDTLNELEFITGPIDSTYGALRASLGYPQPWKLRYVEIGNEDQIGDGPTSYIKYRYAAFQTAINEKYPDIICMSSTGDFTAVSPGSATDFHEYARPDLMASQFGYFDNRVTAEHPTLIGEYAVIQENGPNPNSGVDWNAAKQAQPTWIGAVAEAIFSLGAERNSHGIIGAAYAPILQNRNSYQWSPDLISFTADPSQTILSTSYYVIELLSNNRYTSTVPVASDTNLGPAYWIAGTSGNGKYTLKAAVYNTTETQNFSVTFDGVAEGATGVLTVLTASDGHSSNTIDGPQVVNWDESQIVAGVNGTFQFALGQLSVAVLTT